MILIFSQDGDYSTNKVLEWMNYYSKKYLRVNENCTFEFLSLHLTNGELDFTLSYNKELIYYSQINSIWYRRGGLKFKLDIINLANNVLRNDLLSEFKTIKEFIEYAFTLKPTINSCQKHSVNKLEVLHLATKVGLKIPNTLVLTKPIVEVINGSYVTKPLNYFNPINGCNSFYTSRIIKGDLMDNIKFFPSLFQAEIQKQFEIRSFILNKSFYSMAIFSQNNEQTSVDFRKYSSVKPNRVVPFKIPKEIEMKILLLMEEMKINSGSVDLIFDKNDEYVFLEINPVGQFGMVSLPCNYYLEKLISLKL